MFPFVVASEPVEKKMLLVSPIQASWPVGRSV